MLFSAPTPCQPPLFLSPLPSASLLPFICVLFPPPKNIELLIILSEHYVLNALCIDDFAGVPR